MMTNLARSLSVFVWLLWEAEDFPPVITWIYIPLFYAILSLSNL